MVLGFLKTPLYAVFFYVFLLVACGSENSGTGSSPTSCAETAIPIAHVQGNTSASPLLGERVTVQGVVTHTDTRISGLYMEQDGSDQDSSTSNAIFVQITELPPAATLGALVSVSGKVAELGKGNNTLTAVTSVDSLDVCSSGHPLPETIVTLPLKTDKREPIEGMRIRVQGPLTVTSLYQIAQGKLALAGNGVQFVPTEVMAPGPKTAEMLQQHRSFTLPAMLPQGIQQADLFISGSTINHVRGVMGHDGRGSRVVLQAFQSDPPPGFLRPTATKGNDLRVVGMNLHNYFNGDGKGHEFPTPRGAKTPEEFARQGERIGAAIGVLKPHVLAVMELENDGFHADSAAMDFIRLANAASGTNWAVARPADDNTGSDKITVGVFYRADLLKPIGVAQTLTGPDFNRSRQPIAQVFQPVNGSDKILIVVNHLKSKGSCPESGANANRGDGQGCWNPARVSAAEKMTAWVTRLADGANVSNVLILGDMNAYRHEDPVNAIRQAGYNELMDGAPERVYSFVYSGQAGTLDYAFSSEALQQKVKQAFIWNVNAALPSGLDQELPHTWLRFSDHDPVVVDIRLHHSPTSD